MSAALGYEVADWIPMGNGPLNDSELAWMLSVTDRPEYMPADVMMLDGSKFSFPVIMSDACSGSACTLFVY